MGREGFRGRRLGRKAESILRGLRCRMRDLTNELRLSLPIFGGREGVVRLIALSLRTHALFIATL